MDSVPTAEDASPVRFSIIIATRNRATSIQACLASIERLDFPSHQFELLVVNDGSTDDSRIVLDQFAARTALTTRIFHQPHAGISAARNRAIEASVGHFIAFTDDDCTVDPGWLQGFLRAFQDEHVGGVGGTVATDVNGVLGRYMAFHHILDHDPEGVYLKPAIITANACYRGDLVRSLGGFDLRARPTGEDLDLSWRVSDLGYRLARAPHAVVTHHFSPHLRHFPRRFYGYGVGSGYLQTKHKLGMELAPPIPLHRALSPRYVAYKARWYRRRHGILLPDSIRFATLDSMQVASWWLGYVRGPSPQPHGSDKRSLYCNSPNSAGPEVAGPRHGEGWRDAALRSFDEGMKHPFPAGQKGLMASREAMSPTHLVQTTREYVLRDHLAPRTALGLAVYDHTRTLAWWMGFTYGRLQRAVRLHAQGNR